MTVSNLPGLSPVANLFKWIFRTAVDKKSTHMALGSSALAVLHVATKTDSSMIGLVVLTVTLLMTLWLQATYCPTTLIRLPQVTWFVCVAVQHCVQSQI